MADIIRFKRGKSSTWSAEEDPLKKGEPGYDTERNVLKIGNGSDSWSDLEQLKAVPEGWVNVKDFGAKGNEETDDTEAIQKAIDYAKINNKNVYIPNGIYLTDGLVLENANNLTIFGLGTLKATPNHSSYYHILEIKNSSYINIFGITFDGDADNNLLSQFNHAIYNEANNHVKIENCIFKNISGDGITVTVVTSGENSHYTIQNNIFNRTGRCGVSFITAKNSIIKNNYFTETSWYEPVAAIDLEPNHDTEIIQDIIIEGNIIENMYKRGIQLEHSVSNNLENRESVFIRNNVIKNGMENSATGINIRHFKNVYVFDNKISNTTLEGIKLINEFENIYIENNIIEKAYNFGIYISNTGALRKNITIIKNIIKNTKQNESGASYGIYVMGDSVTKLNIVHIEKNIIFDDQETSTQKWTIKVNNVTNLYWDYNITFGNEDNTSGFLFTPSSITYMPIYFPKFSTASRPSSPWVGMIIFDTDLKKYIVFNGTDWVNLSGSSLE